VKLYIRYCAWQKHKNTKNTKIKKGAFTGRSNPIDSSSPVVGWVGGWMAGVTKVLGQDKEGMLRQWQVGKNKGMYRKHNKLMLVLIC
jgi:hypothetical protein